MDLPQQTVAVAAAQCGVDLKLAEGWLGRANNLRQMHSSAGTQRHRFQPLAGASQGDVGYGPVRPLHQTETEIIARYAPLLEQLASDPERNDVLILGLDAYVHTVWLTKDYAVFHHPDSDGTAARSFLGLLQAMHLQLQSIRFVRFQPRSQEAWPHRWRQCLGQTKYISFDIQSSPNPGAKATASWLAIEPRFHFQANPKVNSPGLAGFRYLMVMGYIAFGSR